MNKKEIKKEYENIQISASEKAKIYNNIMERKNKKNIWLPILGFAGLAACCAGVAFLLQPVNNTTNKSLNKSDNEYTLETNYRKEIMVNAKQYLANKNIDVDDLESETTIDAKDIVDDDKYDMCTGSLIIKKNGTETTYSTNVNCNSDGVGKEIEYRIYDGKLSNVIEVENGIIIVSLEITKEQEEYATDDATGEEIKVSTSLGVNSIITYYNNEGKEVWSTKYTGLNSEDDPAQSSPVLLQQNGDKLDIIMNINYDYEFYKNGGSSCSVTSYFVEIDNTGKIIKDEEIKYNDEEFGNGDVLGDNLLEISSKYNDNHYLLSIENGELIFTPYNPFAEEKEDGIATTYNPLTIYNNKIYGYIKSKSYDEREILEMNTLYYQDTKNSNNIKKVELSENDYIYEIKIVDDRVYVLASNNIYEYDLELNYVRTIEVETLDGEEEWSNISLMTDNNQLVINKTTKSEDVFFYIDKEGKTEDTITIDLSNINDSFDYNYIVKNSLKNKKITQAYSVTEELNNEILLVFNK